MQVPSCSVRFPLDGCVPQGSLPYTTLSPSGSQQPCPFPQSLEIGLGYTSAPVKLGFLLYLLGSLIYHSDLYNQFLCKQTVCHLFLVGTQIQKPDLHFGIEDISIYPRKMKILPTSDLSLNSTRYNTTYLWLPNLNS